MKKHNLLPLLVVLSLLLSLLAASVWAADGNPDENEPMPAAETGDTGFQYEKVNNTITITGYQFSYDTAVTEITIPQNIEGLPVTAIGANAFDFSDSLTSVTVPDSVTSIGESAFSYCKELTSITIPQGVTSIEASAFDSCEKLTSITIPESVTSIGERAFFSCKELTSINIPSGVTSIGESAFYSCEKLTSITIPGSVTSIGKYAFEGSGVTSVTIENGVTTIGERVFLGCKNLTSVTIPDSVTSIGESAFFNCKNLTNINIPNSVTSIGERALGLTGVTSINIPEGVAAIENGVFTDCVNLTSVTLPETVTSIGEDAFARCVNLTQVNIPEECTSFGETAFYETGVTSITIPNGVTTISDSMFAQCKNLTEITIPASVTVIEYAAFNSCDKLQTVNYGGTIAAWEKVIIGYANNALSGKTIKCSDGDTTWTAGTVKNHEGVSYWLYGDEYMIVYHDNSVADIVIPEELDGVPVTSIHRGSFYKDGNDSKLRSIVIPDSVTYIGRNAFHNCVNLAEVTLPKNLKTIERTTFLNCKSLTSVNIPGSVTELGSTSFNNCTSLTSIYIPKSVTLIKSSAFSGDDRLKDVYYEGNESEWAKITIEQYNDKLTGATIHYNATAPSGGGDETIYYTVTFTGGQNAAGTDPVMPDKASGQTFTLPDNPYTWAGYRFAGWSDGANTYTVGTVYTMPAENVIFTAKWEIEPDRLEEIGNMEDPQEAANAIRDLDADALKTALENDLAAGDSAGSVSRMIEKIEEKLTELTLITDYTPETYAGFDTTAVKITGAKLNLVNSEKEVTFQIGKAKKEPPIPSAYAGQSVVRFSMDLSGISNKETLNVPVKITLPIPTGLDADRLVVVHYHDSGRVEEIEKLYISDGKVSFILTGFSEFAMTQKPASTPSGSSPSGGGGGGSGRPAIKQGDKPAAPGTTTPSGGGTGFSDVAASAWYADSVKYVVEKGLFSGVGNGNFAPNANMTRAMMWTVLARYMGVDTGTGSNWYEAARTWAIEKGISDGTMADGNVTREQFVTMLWRLSGEPAVTNSASFTDSGKVSTYAKTAVDWAVEQGIVNGYSDGTFKPQGSATRAEVAKMLNVFCQNADNASSGTAADAG